MSIPAVPDKLDIRIQVLKLAYPILIENLFITLIFYVDRIMIGRVGEAELAAMSMVGPVWGIMMAFIAPFSIGTIAIVSRSFYKYNSPEARTRVATILGISLIAGVAASLTGTFFLPKLCYLFSGSNNSQAVQNAVKYISIIGLSGVFLFLRITISAILRAGGNTWIPMYVGIIGNLINIFLNTILMFGYGPIPAFGLAGAAYATVCATSASSLLLIAILFSGYSSFRIKISDLAFFSKDAAISFFKVSLPSVIEPLLITMGYTVYTIIIAGLGQVYLAAFSVVVTIEALSFMPLDALAVACSVKVGSSLGSNENERAKSYIRETVKIAILILSLIGLLYLTVPQIFISLFVSNDSSESIYNKNFFDICRYALMISVLEQPFFAFAVVLSSGINGAGDTKSTMLINVLIFWTVRLPLCYFFAITLDLKLNGVILTWAVDWGVRSLFLYFGVYKKEKWQRINCLMESTVCRSSLK